LQILVEVLAKLADQIAVLDREIANRVKEDPIARRLMTIPGVGPITAAALLALAPAPQAFQRGRDFSAWLGLTPLQKSTGGKQKLGQITRMGERTLRRLLVIGASAVIKQALLKGAAPGSWLAQMLSHKPRMLVAVALANKTARIVWALLTTGGIYRAPALAS
jgi:transposase